MPSMSDQARTARMLLQRQSVGVLSTHSVDVEAYPFGSIATYVLNYDGAPTMLISDIAQHTRNIKQDKRVSLTIFDQCADDPQASSRLTWIGNAEPVDPSDTKIRHRYLRYFPSAESYFETHDFSLYCIHLLRARFIGGFGEIYWIEPDAMLLKNPLCDTERSIVEHTNQDHEEALFHCQKIRGQPMPQPPSKILCLLTSSAERFGGFTDAGTCQKKFDRAPFVGGSGFRRDLLHKLREWRPRIQERGSAALLRHNRDARNSRRIEGRRENHGRARPGRAGDACRTNDCPLRHRRCRSAASAGRGEDRATSCQARTAGARSAS